MEMREDNTAEKKELQRVIPAASNEIVDGQFVNEVQAPGEEVEVSRNKSEEGRLTNDGKLEGDIAKESRKLSEDIPCKIKDSNEVIDVVDNSTNEVIPEQIESNE